MPELVLVTGGAGFIGSHTVDRLLAQGFAVRVVDNLHPQVHPGGSRPRHLSPGVELVHADVRDLDAMRRAVRGVSRILHLAAETSVGQSMYQSDLHVDVNVRGTATLFRAIRERGGGVDRVVLSSSRAVYGEGAHRCSTCGDLNPGPRSVDDLTRGVWSHRCPVCGGALTAIPTTEDVAPRYCSSYGMTKLFQEQVVAMEADQLEIPVVTLRYFNVYGPRQSLSNPYTGLIVTLALRLLRERTLVLYEGGTPVRDFVHVDDVVTANLAAMTHGVEGATTLNVGTGVGVGLTELAAALGRAFGREPRVELSRRFRVGDIHAAIADASRLRDVLGIEPAVHIDAGLGTLVPSLGATSAEDRSEAVEVELRRQGVLRG
jgi:dTDP-L-rhamnose 4-epimerase